MNYYITKSKIAQYENKNKSTKSVDINFRLIYNKGIPNERGNADEEKETTYRFEGSHQILDCVSCSHQCGDRTHKTGKPLVWRGW